MIETSWFWRRAVVIAVLAVALGLLVGLAVATTIYRVDTALARDIAGTAGLIIMSTVGTYIAGAAWDDRNRMIHGRDGASPPPAYPIPPAPYAPPPPAITQPPMPPPSPSPSPAKPAPYVDDGDH